MAGDHDIEQRLLAQGEEARRRLAVLRDDFASIVDASEQSNADDEHDPEGATIAFERAQVQALTHQAERRIEEVDSALLRLAAGDYGRCEVCGGRIPEERLEARPMAMTCVGCSGAGPGGV
ncbi:MAG: TraR/DksA C4-type zinc finger protein, partial [Nocardioides sp.]|nr:TraR/DksA C4-type zinc finger protein [Nocardioides sp.]